MKRQWLAACCLLLAACCFSLPAFAASTPKDRSFTCLTGSTFGCLDKVPIVHPTDNTRDLVTGDKADVDAGGIRYFYHFDKTATYDEDSPRYIRPDDYATNGPGVWILSGIEVVSATVKDQFRLPSSDADPTSAAGYLRHDSTVADHANGALRWHDGTALRTVVDILATESLVDGYTVTWDATNGQFYLSAAGAGGSVATDAIWDAAGDLAVGSGSNTATRLAIGTAGQILKVNAGATAPEWTGTLNISRLSLGGIILGDDTPDETGEITVDATSDQFQWYGASSLRAVSPKHTSSIVVPSVADTDDLLFTKLPYGITVTALDCIVSAATSATINIQECNGTGAACADMATSNLVCDTDGANTTTFSNAAADSGDWLKLNVASISGTPGTLTVTVTYTVTPD